MPIRLTRTVKIISIACFVVFIIQQTADQFFGANLLYLFGLIPAGVVNQFRFWQLITYAFLHADVMHLIFNLMMLVFIGSELEALWGRARFLRFYFFCALVAGLFYLFLQVVLELTTTGGGNLHAPMVGASGAIYGLLVAYGIIFRERVLLFMLLFPMKAKHFVWILAGVEFMTTVFSSRSGIAGIAHLGGMAAGVLYLYVAAYHRLLKKRRELRAKDPHWRKSRRGPSSHLRLVINNNDDVEDRDADESGPKTWN